MITHIRVKNFKSWKDSGEVKLAPLTGFFGTNSSGKSSLLQMLLLLKQTAERSNAEEGPALEDVIFFGDENSLVNLGNFREVIHRHELDKTLELEVGYNLQNPFTVQIPRENTSKYDQNSTLIIDRFTFDTAIHGKWKKPWIERFRYRVGPHDFFEIKYQNHNLFLNGSQLLEDINVNTCFGGPPILKEKTVVNPDILGKFASAFYHLFSCCYYLGPARIYPKRSYYWEGTHPESIGQNGEEMIAALLSARVDQRTTSYKGQNVPIEERISWWLREMELAYSFSLQRTGTRENRNYEVQIQKSSDSAKVTLSDMGYGLSQFLPVLVHCYYAPEKSTLILEQPGMHLHPKVQSQLADLLIEVITERNLHILIESHSEHLLNRLQRRVAEEKIAADQTTLYFCRNDEGVSTIERLQMDELGNITNWPENFFGDEMGDLFAMTKAQRERQKKAEG